MMRLIVLLPLIGLSACDSAQSSTAKPFTSPYIATAIGRVDSREDARNLVASVDGVIETLSVRIGDEVSQGQQLMQISCGPRHAMIAMRTAGAFEAAARRDLTNNGARAEDISAARAELRVHQASSADAKDRLARAQALIPRGFVSGRSIVGLENEVSVNEAKSAAASAALASLQNGSRAEEKQAASAALSVANAQTTIARASNDECSVRSPINGTVLQILRQPGEFSGASQGVPLIIVGDLSQMAVRAEVTDRAAALIKQGQSASIWIDGQSGTWRGRVVRLANVMGRRSARSLDPTDRFDRDVREVLITFPSEAPPKLVGLRVNVGFRP